MSTNLDTAMHIHKIEVTVFPEFPAGFKPEYIEFVISDAAKRLHPFDPLAAHKWEINKHEMLERAVNDMIGPDMEIVGTCLYGELSFTIKGENIFDIQSMLVKAQEGFAKGLHKSGVLRLKEWKHYNA